MQKANENRYLYPPRPDQAISREMSDVFGSAGYVAQLKFNDTRCMIKYCSNGDVQLWNRHAERVKNYTAHDWFLDELREVAELLDLQPNSYSLLDGGLLDSKHKAIKDTYVLWDILVKNGEHLLGTTYAFRYDLIEQAVAKSAITEPYVHVTPRDTRCYRLGRHLTEHVFVPDCLPQAQWDAAWDKLLALNENYEQPLVEGLVFKDPTGELQYGMKEKNNMNWLAKTRVKTGRHVC